MNIMSYYESPDEKLLFWVIIILAFLFFIILWFNNIKPFIRDREYIKMELNRSFDEERADFWREELKKNYLRYIPFIGKYFR